MRLASVIIVAMVRRRDWRHCGKLRSGGLLELDRGNILAAPGWLVPFLVGTPEEDWCGDAAGADLVELLVGHPQRDHILLARLDHLGDIELEGDEGPPRTVAEKIIVKPDAGHLIDPAESEEDLLALGNIRHGDALPVPAIALEVTQALVAP